MTNITNMKTLRQKMLKAFDAFENGEIDHNHLTTLAKANEAIISGLKAEMQYAILTKQQPYIEFFGEGSGITLEEKDIKKLL